MKKLIIFDFFGTLAYFPKINGFLLYLRLMFLGYDPLAKKDFKEHLKTFLSSSKSWEDLAEKIANCLGKETDERLVKLLQKTVKFKLYDEGRQILAYLRKENHPVAILTNGGSFLFEDFTLPGVRIFTPQITGWEKPHQNAFLYVLKAYGSAPERTLMIGDSLTDVLPASALKIEAFLLNKKEKMGWIYREAYLTTEKCMVSFLYIKKLKEIKTCLF